MFHNMPWCSCKLCLPMLPWEKESWCQDLCQAQTGCSTPVWGANPHCVRLIPTFLLSLSELWEEDWLKNCIDLSPGTNISLPQAAASLSCVSCEEEEQGRTVLCQD